MFFVMSLRLSGNKNFKIIYIYIFFFFKRKKGRNYIFPTTSLFRGLRKEYSSDYRVYTRKIYISGKLKKFKVQLLRSNALFLCRHENTSSLRLLSDERSGRQIIRNFSFRQRLHLLLELL